MGKGQNCALIVVLDHWRKESEMHGVLVGKGVNLLFHSPSCLFMVKITGQESSSTQSV